MEAQRDHGSGRRGGVYVGVLLSAVLVAVIAFTAMAIVRVQRTAAAAESDGVKARLAAESAVELASQLIAADDNWRQTWPAGGAWLTNRPLDESTYTIEGIDPVDGNTRNRIFDPIIIRGTGRCRQATQIVEARLYATGAPISALGYAVLTAGQFHVDTGATLKVSGARASTNATLRNQGTIDGDAEALLALPAGTITGTLTIISLPTAMPPSGIIPMYAALGTVIAPATDIDRAVLSPQRNPWGAPNPDGVYIVNLGGGSLRIRDSRIHGTLIVRGSSGTVTVDKSVLMQTTRPDFPALIVEGDLHLVFDGTGSNLSESDEGTNFNPSGAPYEGVTDSDTSDVYPSRIEGLVHVMGALELGATSLVRGGIICESAALADAVLVSGTPEIQYDSALMTNPPMGYTTNAQMRIQAGTWTQVVNP